MTLIQSCCSDWLFILIACVGAFSIAVVGWIAAGGAEKKE